MQEVDVSIILASRMQHSVRNPEAENSKVDNLTSK